MLPVGFRPVSDCSYLLRCSGIARYLFRDGIAESDIVGDPDDADTVLVR